MRIVHKILVFIAASALAATIVPAAQAAGGPATTGEDRGQAVELAREPAPPELKILNWNICGSPAQVPEDHEHYPIKCRDVPVQDKLKKIMDYVKAKDINVIMLQETCLTTYTKKLQSMLGGPDEWKRASWIATYPEGAEHEGDTIGCPRVGVAHGNPAGDTEAERKADGGGSAVLVKRWDHDDLWKTELTFAGTETPNGKGVQGAVCIKDRRFKYMACTSHFAGTGHAELRRKSAEDFGNDAKRQRRTYGYRMVIGGDFNMTDTDSDFTTYLKPGRDNAAPGAERDHVLFDKAGWEAGSVDGEIIDDPEDDTSDHPPIYARALRQQDRPGDHDDAVKGSLPSGLDCQSNNHVSVCWQPYGDKFWVKDNKADGKKAMVEWAASNPSEDVRYWRSGVCRGLPAADGWAVCNKNIREDTEIAIRGFVYQENGDRRDTTDPIWGAIT